MAEFTHFDGDGNAHMVDVGSKPATARRAIVKGHVKMAPATLKMICDGTAKKGDYIIADDNGKGIACPIGLADMNSMLVIGVALEDGEGTIEVKV